ncbi:MAG: hypothetical protein K0S03_713 [Burkholderiales bacterium]|nr:hypothetical protein [Burkholderiales bacterium]
MVTGSASRVEGTKESTITSVSESMKTSFTNSSGPRQRRWECFSEDAREQDAFGDHLNASAAAFFTQSPPGSTKWPCTSKMNSPSPPTEACASSGSSAASRGMPKKPPVFPAAALAALKASSVLAAPHAETRKLRREMPSRFEFTDAH